MITYEFAKMVAFVLMIIIGLAMVIMPKQCTQKEYREDPYHVAKIRRSGFVTMGCGVVMIILNILI